MLRGTTDATVTLFNLTLEDPGSSSGGLPSLLGSQVRLTHENGLGNATNQITTTYCAPIQLSDVAANLQSYIANPGGNAGLPQEPEYQHYSSLKNFKLSGYIQSSGGTTYSGNFNVSIRGNDSFGQPPSFGIYVDVTFQVNSARWPANLLRPIYTLKFVDPSGCVGLSKKAIDVGQGLTRGRCLYTLQGAPQVDKVFDAKNTTLGQCAQGDMSGKLGCVCQPGGGVLHACWLVQFR